MNHEDLMRIAIEKARKGVEDGQLPFGACIARDGKIISIGHNTVNRTMDVTAHAEMNAIRMACKKLVLSAYWLTFSYVTFTLMTASASL